MTKKGEPLWLGKSASQLAEAQREVCRRYEARPFSAPPGKKLGIARNIGENVQPINGIRHLPEGETTGWYIWRGELSDDPEFFLPLHVDHLKDWCPVVIPYLQLPPGYRFQIAPGYEDVWYDPKVLEEP
jgi:hypothetical protein